ncbi:MAG: bifunctional diaminohydroxyphosphoribosylaminopyrimidine deaminase/5-amino-6-(5-phosphoribosylamino)uracil reductase RibD [Candidatus Cloacimonetes bacterium]|nr:bifunctional diaminohydroxyphosphoribosylaminopyrimidine deaminase/5-amino-6-(5-phosphoribosylamino)uracil reductase RibD [Candidatus Cloacimonadota bacterium]
MYESKFMELAISLAEKGFGLSSPNPVVGAVIVKEGRVIGEGYTLPYGDEHAEVIAIKNCKEDPNGADLYVTLEPCSHYGKTPPSVEAIYKAGIKNVFAGLKDPNPKVNGKGFFMLQTARINVEYPFYEDIIKKQLEYYLFWVQTKKPFIILKNISSLDGKLGTENGDPLELMNEHSIERIAKLRAEVDAFMTFKNESIIKYSESQSLNSSRTTNDWQNLKLPYKVIIDHGLDQDIESTIFQNEKISKTIVFYNKNNNYYTKMDIDQNNGLILFPIEEKNGFLNIDEIFLKLGDMNIVSFMIESDTKMNSYLLKNGYVNKIYYLISPKILGGNKNVFDSLNLTKIEDHIYLDDIKIEMFENEILIIGYPKSTKSSF